MKVSFQLIMPNVGSWNNKWTGAAKLYFVIRTYGKFDSRYLKAVNLLGRDLSRYFYYNFDDGWGASVKMEIIDAKEANKRIKASSGFCGYEWMIDSILKLGKIDADYDKKINELTQKHK